MFKLNDEGDRHAGLAALKEVSLPSAKTEIDSSIVFRWNTKRSKPSFLESVKDIILELLTIFVLL